MVGMLLTAKIALPAREIRINRYPFATVVLGDIFSDLDDLPHELMAGNQWEGTKILIVVDM
jgi:hypothetical protein